MAARINLPCFFSHLLKKNALNARNTEGRVDTKTTSSLKTSSDKLDTKRGTDMATNVGPMTISTVESGILTSPFLSMTRSCLGGYYCADDRACYDTRGESSDSYDSRKMTNVSRYLKKTDQHPEKGCYRIRLTALIAIVVSPSSHFQQP